MSHNRLSWINTEYSWKWKLLSHIWLFVGPWTVAPRLLCPCNSPGKNTGVGSHSLLQWIFLTQGSNPGVRHYRQMLYPLSHQGSPGSIPRLGRSPGEENSYPFQYSCLENYMDRGDGELQSMGLQRVGHDWATSLHFKVKKKQWDTYINTCLSEW